MIIMLQKKVSVTCLTLWC